ncbi:hypothetical protein [Paracoccus rhizosphaerae]|uniref:MYXO-CTERM domain-containing protein n=1 Tax=Paracoccus rhizosphaerae TaxID=1133347 RepID=A0ABV6CFQ7_9RHOB|nr:hypothetical protein [Paracoccus rhizosphaerae]
MTADNDGRDGLNPALKSELETAHDNRISSAAPIETASVQRDEGRSWPIVWAVVVILSALLVLWLIFG